MSAHSVDCHLDPDVFQQTHERFDQDGYVIIDNVLSAETIIELKNALAPYLAEEIAGRNNFEGVKTNRIYALVSKNPIFAELIIHPLVLAFAEADLGKSCLLSACLAINLLPGETAQPWHYDDAHIEIPRPRQNCGISAFWALDAMTEDNGATEVIPGSHLWIDEMPQDAIAENSFVPLDSTALEQHNNVDANVDDPPEGAQKVLLSPGSLMLAKGTLWHRGGANRSSSPRLIITPQYCAGWARQLENMAMTMSCAEAAELPKRAQELLGYSIHPPFMGYVNGVHPAKLLEG